MNSWQLLSQHGARHALTAASVAAWRAFPWPRGRGRYAAKRGIGRLTRPNKTAPMPTDVGWLLLDPTHDRLQTTIFYGGTHYEQEITTFIDQELDLPLGSIVWDIGGHVGYYALKFARCVGPSGRVTVFEPQKTLAERIRRSAALNHHANIHVENKAVGATAGELTLHQLADAGRTSAADSVAHEAQRSFTVPMVSADLYVQQFAPPNLIKLDVEGAESAVLQGASELLGSDTPPTLLVEMHPAQIEALGSSQAELIAHLRSIGRHQLYQIHHRHGTIPLSDPLPDANTWHLYAKPV